MAASSWRHSDLWRASPASRFLRVLSMGALSAMAAPFGADDFAVMLASFRAATSDVEEISLSLSDVFVALMQQDERGQRIVVVRQGRDFYPSRYSWPCYCAKGCEVAMD
jgi:hypothetical protein